MFQTFDDNHDGRIDQSELQEYGSVVSALGLEIMKQGMQRYDKENKGYITRKQFAACILLWLGFEQSSSSEMSDYTCSMVRVSAGGKL